MNSPMHCCTATAVLSSHRLLLSATALSPRTHQYCRKEPEQEPPSPLLQLLLGPLAQRRPTGHAPALHHLTVHHEGAERAPGGGGDVREAGADRRVLCTGLAHTMKGQNEHQGRGAQEQTQTPCRVLPGSNARDKQGKRNFISIRSIGS